MLEHLRFLVRAGYASRLRGRLNASIKPLAQALRGASPVDQLDPKEHVLAHQREPQVLGGDVSGGQLAGLLAGRTRSPPHAFPGVAFEPDSTSRLTSPPAKRPPPRSCRRPSGQAERCRAARS